jgi:hypothetical protein
VRISTLALLVTGMAITPVAAQAFQQVSQKASAARQQQGERLICRYVQETGSVARRRRQCFTRTEWDRIAEAARANGTRMMSDHASGMTSN